MRKKNFYFKALGILRKTFEGIKKKLCVTLEIAVEFLETYKFAKMKNIL